MDQERSYYNLSTLGHQELLRMKQMQLSNPLNQLDFFTNQQAYDWKTFSHDINAKFPRPTAQSEPRSLTLIPSTEDQYPSLSTRALESTSDMNPLLDISNPQLIQKTSSTILALGTPSTIPPIIQPQSQKDPVPPQISPRFATRSTTGNSKPRPGFTNLVETMKLKTNKKKEVKQRSTSDDPALKSN